MVKFEIDVLSDSDILHSMLLVNSRCFNRMFLIEGNVFPGKGEINKTGNPSWFIPILANGDSEIVSALNKELLLVSGGVSCEKSSNKFIAHCPVAV